MSYYDAIIIHFDGNDGIPHNIIIDGGDVNSPKLCYNDKLKPCLQDIFDKGESIDLWIISHIDNDHIGGLIHFMNDKEFFVKHSRRLKNVWMNYGGKGDYKLHKNGDIGYEQGKNLRDLLFEYGIPVLGGISAGLKYDIAGSHLCVVGPTITALQKYEKWWDKKEFADVVLTSDGGIGGNDGDYDRPFADFDVTGYKEDKSITNNSSIAIVLEYNGHRFLFSSDSCSTILKEGLITHGFLKKAKEHFSVMHIPHHGSSRNISKDFLEMLNCENFVITGNGRNKYHLPDKETIARLLSAKPEGFSLHFSNYNSTVKEIFENEEALNVTQSKVAVFNYE